MKYIQRKSSIKLDETTGNIVDTLNVEDKVRNAPSINLVQNMAGVPTEGIIAYETEDGTIPEGYEEVVFNETIPLSTPTSDGLMSAEDKTKLDNMTSVATQSSNGLMSFSDKAKLDGYGDVITVNSSVNIATANTWYDTGIRGNSHLTTGVYIVHIICDWGGQAGQWIQHYAGVMAWYTGGTNSTAAHEISLHDAGHSNSSGTIKLRTLKESTGGYMRLQITSTVAMSAAKTAVLRFKRIM